VVSCATRRESATIEFGWHHSEFGKSNAKLEQSQTTTKKASVDRKESAKTPRWRQGSQAVSRLNHFAQGRPLGHELTTTYSGAYSASLCQQ
jgi:hypothetical protein